MKMKKEYLRPQRRLDELREIADRTMKYNDRIAALDFKDEYAQELLLYPYRASTRATSPKRLL